MLHKISFASITASHNIIAVRRGAAHEAVTKMSKSDILQHVDAVGKSSFRMRSNLTQIHDLHNVPSADSLLTRQCPIVLDNAPMLVGTCI